LKLALAKRNIQFVIVQRPPNEVAVEIARKAALLVVDCGYLRIQRYANANQRRDWRRRVATDVDCQFMQVESDAMVPITSASDKEEFAARTIRPKIMSKLAYFSTPVEPLSLDKSSLKLDLEVDEFDISDIPTVFLEPLHR
jgi:deoxyribodipyrimidine photo-lyase